MSEPEKISTTIRFEVPAGYHESERLDVYLTGFIQNATRAKVQRGIKEGSVTINDRVTKKPSTPVQASDVILCQIMKAPRVEILPEPIELDIVYEDDDVIVVNKRVGMVVHPAYGHRTGTLVHALLHHVGGKRITMSDAETEDQESSEEIDAEENTFENDDPPESATVDTTVDTTGLSSINASPRFEGDVALRPGIVHRIDKDTSGLLVTAKNDIAHVALSRQFADRETRRTYLAIVWGVPENEEGTIDTEVARDTRDRRKMAVVGEGKSKLRGKRAITHYKVVEKFGYTSLVEFRLETGRTHQIRVHAAHIQHPVFGDVAYGGDRIRYGKDEGQRRAFYRNLFIKLPHQALHAISLGFRHPRTSEQLDFECPIPDDLAFVLERLRTFDITRR